MLHLKYTFGNVVQYVGTTTEIDKDVKKIRDVDIIIIVSQLSEGHVSYVWRIINKLHLKYNIILDARLYSTDQLSSDKIPLINKYLLKIFLTDLLGENPFSDFSESLNKIKEECYKRIDEQKDEIVAIMPRVAGHHNQLRAIAQSVYDAIRAFLIINDHPIAEKEATCKYFSSAFPEFSEAITIYEGYLDPNSVLDVASFILDSMAIVKPLLYKAQNKPIANEILLINTPSSIMPHPRDDYLSYDHNMPLGLVCIASYMEREGYPVKILDSYAENFGVLATIDEIFNKNTVPKIIGLNASSPNIHIAHRIASYVKRIRSDIAIACGGAHASLATKHTLSTGHVDYAVVGEGEIPFLKLVRNLFDGVNEEIPGIYSTVSGHIVGKKNNERIDLSKIPIPNFGSLPLERYFSIKKRIYIHSSRGCAFNCLYCSVPNCWGKKVTEIPMDVLIAHLIELLSLYKPEQVQIVDDNFSHKRGQLIKDFCEGIISNNLKFKWKCQVRADQLDLNIVENMARAGCFESDLGIESGNKDIQKYIRKSLDLEKTAEIVAMLNKNNIFCKAFFMLGFPEESFGQISDTINFAVKLKGQGLKDVAFFPVMPFPGTDISKITRQEVFQGAVIDNVDIFEQSFAAHRLRKYSAKPELSLNLKFTPEKLRLLVKFAYQAFSHGAQITNLENQFKEFVESEERNTYGI